MGYFLLFRWVVQVKLEKHLTMINSCGDILFITRLQKINGKKAVYYFKKQYQEVEELKATIKKRAFKKFYYKKWLTLSNDIKQLTVPYLINPQNEKENIFKMKKLREARSNLFLDNRVGGS